MASRIIPSKAVAGTLRLLALLVVLCFLAYHTVCIWLTQRTAGKAMFGLRLRRPAGRSRLVWSLGRASAGYGVVDVFGVGLLLALLDRRHRC